MRRRIKALDPDKARDPRAVRTAAVALLAGRDFASGELAKKLFTQGYEEGLARETVTDLVAGGIVNDSRYAENYVAYHADRGQGPARIAAELRRVGLAAELIEAGIASYSPWPALAREVRIRKFGLKVPKTWAEKGRQARFLQYRGFSSDHIRAALDGDFDPDEAS